jgi:uncharacterized membrane-anchored protein YjiN (DUF445 family)
MSAPALVTNAALDDERRKALRRMRSLAVGLLVLAAVVYVATLDQDGFLGFVNAGAEASMVGAIADWFAVVALFKHPLGLRIPHTALIPERKAMLGRGLEEFVGENFLSDEIVSTRVRGAQPAAKVGHWLAEEANSRRVVHEAADLLGTALRKVRWLEGNAETFHEVVVERAPWWAPDSVNERVIRRLHAELVTWVDDIRREPYHRSRLALDRVLRQVAQDLLTDEDTIDRMERFKVRMLEHPQVSATYISLWNALRRALVEALDDPDGELVRRGVGELQAFGRRLQEDAGLRERLDDRAANLAVFLVDRYGRELTSVITHTIDEWDGREASRKIELHVGKDLQFIRINGTIVGGLVGLIIHAFSVAL